MATVNNVEQFKKVCEDRIAKIKLVLVAKAKEYARGGNRYHNFDVAARVSGTTREKALMGIAMKHLVSILDIIDSPSEYSKDVVDEKIGDMINYLILLEGMLLEFKQSDSSWNFPYQVGDGLL